MLRLGMALLAAALFCSVGTPLLAWPLSFEQRARLQQYMPRTFPKLFAKDPVHVVLIGDGNLYGVSPNEAERISGDALTGFPGVFLDKLAREFFITGGVRLLNPPEGGQKKLQKFGGAEIQVENLASPDASVLEGLRRVKSDVFLNDPDLVLIQYGSSDALEKTSMYCYRRALHHILEECRKRSVDVILFGPTPVNRGGGAMEWGITRPYSSAAEAMAADHGVLFVDSGKALIRWGGAADESAEPMAGTAVIGDQLRRIFHVSNQRQQKEFRHLNAGAHQRLGEAAYYELMDGAPRSDFACAASAVHGEKGMARVVVSVRNQSRELKSGIVGALQVGGLSPVNPAQRYRVEPGNDQEITFDYTRPVIGKSNSGEDMFYPLEVNDKSIRFPFIIEDGIKCEFLDLPPLRVAPVTISWETQHYINIQNHIKVEWSFFSGSDKKVSGTYRIGIGDSVQQSRPFSVNPLGRQLGSASLPINPPRDADCFQSTLWIELDVQGKKYRFARELEASRDLVLGEKVMMVSGSQYGSASAGRIQAIRGNWAPTIYFDAAVNGPQAGLYCVANLDGLKIPNLGNAAALRAELTIDGRPRGRVRDFGAVSPIVVYFKGSGGNGYVSSVPIGAFGEGYNMELPPGGIGARLERNQLLFRIPKDYLDKHDWSMESGSMLGVGVRIFVVDPASKHRPFPVSRSFATHSPQLMDRDEVVRGMTEEDARGLTTLHFSRRPVNSWSVRIY